MPPSKTARSAVVLPFRRRDPDEAPPERNALRRRHDRAIARLALERDAIRAKIGPIEDVTEVIDKLEKDGSAESAAALPIVYLFRAMRRDLDRDLPGALADATRALESVLVLSKFTKPRSTSATCRWPRPRRNACPHDRGSPRWLVSNVAVAVAVADPPVPRPDPDRARVRKTATATATKNTSHLEHRTV